MQIAHHGLTAKSRFSNLDLLSLKFASFVGSFIRKKMLGYFLTS
jgi:hypothetical protein